MAATGRELAGGGGGGTAAAAGAAGAAVSHESAGAETLPAIGALPSPAAGEGAIGTERGAAGGGFAADGLAVGVDRLNSAISTLPTGW